MAARPHDPTAHPGSRAEAEQYAMKNRGTGDWFRHDGPNVEAPPPGVSRMGDQRGAAVAEKSKGQPEQWYHHDHENPTDPAPAGRTHTDEAKNSKQKVDWYRHDEKAGEVSPQKLSPQVEPPPFAVGKPAGGETSDAKATPRMTNPDAEDYFQRNVHGSASDWFGHDKSEAASAAPICQSPRGNTGDGGKIKEKLGKESENWFDYDANKSYKNPAPVPKGSNQTTKDMVQKSRGAEMDQIMQRSAPEAAPTNTRVKPEDRDVAEKNRKGLMDKYMQQAPDYDSPKPVSRVKPEASDIAEKNKGIMGDCLQGYCDPPVQHDVKRVKPEAESTAKQHQGTANMVITGEAPSVSNGNPSKAVKSEAAANAERNKGSLGGIFSGVADMEVSSRTSRMGSDSARQNAIRNQGSLGGVLGFKG